MATQPVSLEEYLDTQFEYDCEWVDGAIVERNGGEYDHASLLTLIGALFMNCCEDWKIRPLLSVRIFTSPTRIRVPDLTILRSGAPRERILTHLPLLVIEIQSPEDTLRRTAAKAAEYLTFGIEHVWVIDPNARVGYRAASDDLELARGGELAIPESPIRIVLATSLPNWIGFNRALHRANLIVSINDFKKESRYFKTE